MFTLNNLYSFFLTKPVMAAGLVQSLGQAAGIINNVGLVVMFAGLMGAAVSALSERHIGGVKTSLAIAAVGGLAFILCQTFFAAGGQQNAVELQAVN